MRGLALFSIALSVLLLQVVPSHQVFAQCAPAACAGPGIPCAATSNVSNLLVGSGRTNGDLGGSSYEVHVRDSNMADVGGAIVTLDFSSVTAQTSGTSTQEPGTTLDCALATLTRTANAEGKALFHPQFGGGVNAPNVAVYANGVCLGNTRPRSTDVFQTSGAMTDLTDFGGGPICASCPAWGMAEAYLDPLNRYDVAFDYNDDGFVRLYDLSVFSADYARQLIGTYCPSGW